ncbi:MAG: glycosyltransferase family 39 protein [Solirubrobacterales bacterium]
MPLRRRLLWLTAAALAVRLSFIALEPATDPVADETMWTTWGASVLPSPEVHFSPLLFRLIFHPPLYPYFIGVLYGLFGTLTAVKVAQAVLSSLLVPALGRIGQSLFGERAGLAAAGMAAFYPELVWFSAHFWVETLFVVLLWWGFERLLAADREASAPTAAAAGLLLGLSILARETVLYFLPFAALWLAWRRPRGLSRAAIFLAAALGTIAPWTWRNWVAYDAFVPVSTAGALNLWQGNATLSREEVYEQYWAVRGRIEKYRFARQKGLEAIRDRQPTWLFEKLRQEMPNFWEADSQALVHVVRGAYGPYKKETAVAVAVVVLAPFLAVLVLFVFGLAALPRERGPLLLAAFLAYYVLIHVATHGYARYRLPAMPVLFLIAAFGWAAFRSGVYPLLTPARKAIGLATALTLALSVAPTLLSWFTEPWDKPVEAGEVREDAS